MRIPLYNRLKKQAHRDVATAQDMIMCEIYSFLPKAVIHGGTVIWRCYGGNRFSEDLDFYLPSRQGLPEFFQSLKRNGFQILKQRVKENSLYSLLEFNRSMVRVEAVFSEKKAILRDYELVDGNLITVYTLSAEDLLEEKISAFLNRKKVRDLYDIFFLLRLVRVKPKNLDAVADVKVEDEEVLPAIILSGPIVTVGEIRRYIESWEP